jgi:hypothetical protein
MTTEQERLETTLKVFIDLLKNGKQGPLNTQYLECAYNLQDCKEKNESWKYEVRVLIDDFRRVIAIASMRG